MEPNLQVSSKIITESIAHFVISLKAESNYVSVSNSVLRTGRPLLDQKEYEVNLHLKNLCTERNLLGNTKKFKSHHLDKAKFHLNY